MKGNVGLEGIFKKGLFALDGLDELRSQVEEAGVGSGRSLSARSAIGRCRGLCLGCSGEGQAPPVRGVFVDLADQLGHVGPGAIQTGGIEAGNVALSLVAL